MPEAIALSACPVKRNSPLTSAVIGLQRVGDTGLEPVTPSLSSKRANNASENGQALAATGSAACTSACTSEAENVKAAAPETSLDALAAAVASLSAEDRAKLVAMLGNADGRPA